MPITRTCRCPDRSAAPSAGSRPSAASPPTRPRRGSRASSWKPPRRSRAISPATGRRSASRARSATSDAKYRNFIGPTGVDVANVRVFQNTPDWTLSATPTLSVPGRRRGRSPPIDGVVSQPDASVRNRQPVPRPAGLHAARRRDHLCLRRGERYSIGIHGKNLTDKRYKTSGYQYINSTIAGVPILNRGGGLYPDAGQGRHRDRLLRQSAAGVRHDQRQVLIPTSLAPARHPGDDGRGEDVAMTEHEDLPAGYRGLVLAMLLLVYTFNFLDRQILGILAQPIKADLGLTDTQLGALGGIAFALLYSTLAIPLALLADRTSRSWVITVSLAVWSGFTALCGARDGLLAAVRLSPGRRRRRGGRRRAVLCADRRLFPGRSRGARACRSIRSASRSGWPAGVARRLYRDAGRTGARRSSPSASWASSSPRSSAWSSRNRAKRRRRRRDRAPVSAVFAHPRAQAQLLADGVRRVDVELAGGYGLAFWTPSLLIRSSGSTWPIPPIISDRCC